MVLVDRAANLLELLAVELDGSEAPVILVCHSLGGLLAKQMLRIAHDSRDPELLLLTSRIRGIAFIATPHAGSDVASIMGVFKCFLRVNEVTHELERNAVGLRDLNQWFRDNCSSLGLRIKSYCESKPTYGAVVVKRDSVDLGLPGHRPVPIDADHISITKPVSRDDFFYRSVRRFVDATGTDRVPGTPCRLVFKFDGSLDTLTDSQRSAILGKLAEIAGIHPIQIEPVGDGCIEVVLSASDMAAERLLAAAQRGDLDRLGLIVANAENESGEQVGRAIRVQVGEKDEEMPVRPERPFSRGATVLCFRNSIEGFDEFHQVAMTYLPEKTDRIENAVVYLRRILLQLPEDSGFEWVFFAHSNLIPPNSLHTAKAYTNETHSLFELFGNLALGPDGSSGQGASLTTNAIQTLQLQHRHHVRYLLHHSLLAGPRSLRLDLAGARRWVILHDS